MKESDPGKSLDPNEYVNDDPYYGINLECKFYDLNSLNTNTNVLNNPIFLSLNVQSLQSKFEDLKTLIMDLVDKNVQIDVLALQET